MSADKTRHRVFLVRMEADTSLTDEEAMDTLNWRLDIGPYGPGEDAPMPADVSAIKWTLAVDVTPPSGVDRA